MDQIRTGRSTAKPRRAVRDRKVLAGYAALMRGRFCELCEAEVETGHLRSAPWEHLHHVLGGSGREDAEWNLVAICAFHHQHPTHGCHGADPMWPKRRIFELKLKQGYQLPPAAWAFLAEGRDACPTPEPDQAANRRVTEERSRWPAR